NSQNFSERNQRITRTDYTLPLGIRTTVLQNATAPPEMAGLCWQRTTSANRLRGSGLGEHGSQPGHTLADLLRRRIREVNAQRVLATTVRVERAARHKRNLLLDGALQQLRTIDALRHRHPQEQAAAGARPGDARREQFVHQDRKSVV